MLNSKNIFCGSYDWWLSILNNPELFNYLLFQMQTLWNMEYLSVDYWNNHGLDLVKHWEKNLNNQLIDKQSLNFKRKIEMKMWNWMIYWVEIFKNVKDKSNKNSLNLIKKLERKIQHIHFNNVIWHQMQNKSDIRWWI